MNKKLNTVFFILGATVVNMLVMGIILLAGLYLLSLFLSENTDPKAAQVLFLLVFGVSIAGSFFIYHRVMKLISKKIDMDKYFHPILKSRKK